MLTHTDTKVIDWTDCPLVERVPGKVSGVPILKHSRVQADSIVENFGSGSPVEEIAENFNIPEDTIRAVLSYATQKPEAHLEQPRTTRQVPHWYGLHRHGRSAVKLPKSTRHRVPCQHP